MFGQGYFGGYFGGAFFGEGSDQEVIIVTPAERTFMVQPRQREFKAG